MHFTTFIKVKLLENWLLMVHCSLSAQLLICLELLFCDKRSWDPLFVPGIEWWGVWKRVTFRLMWAILTCSSSSWLYNYSPFIHLSNRLYHPGSLYFLTFLFMHSLKPILLMEIFNNYLATKGWFPSCFSYNLLLFTIISSFYLLI